MDPKTGETLAKLLTAAWLLPLLGFAVEIFAGYLWSRRSKAAAYLAVGCIVGAFLCSASALYLYRQLPTIPVVHHEASHQHGKAGHDETKPVHGEGTVVAKEEEHHTDPAPRMHSFSGTHYVLAKFSNLKISIDWYIDSLTIVMFAMVTLIASCIHVFAMGYMSEELTEEYEDHQVHTSHGHFSRPGRFYKFFAFLSLFCFSMLGLVLAGNIFLVFVFWELVGVCSYFLIGFYIERKSASTAANKAFIMNRVGDFGFLIGLMIIWTSFGTFQFATRTEADGQKQLGLFDMVRGADGKLDLQDEPGKKAVLLTDDHDHPLLAADGTRRSIPYILLIGAGLGVFAGCVGKSAQFPLQTWLPDAMEGPTPVSALVHSATMVAAGVYLAGRFYPMFVPEVQLVIAYVGAITLFVAATIAIVATDIKRVLAYSTISQLGYMMLAIGLGGWAAGLFHLITHAFFKSLMFLCSGSVIYGCHHVQEMPQMGGLRKKMPITAYTMLIGVIAICGLAIPGVDVFFGGVAAKLGLPASFQNVMSEKWAFSGYHSKDAIVATAMTYAQLNPLHALLFILPLAGAGITAFYMFRLWFYTFAGKPRDQHVYDHAHESPWLMTAPLILLAAFAAFCACGGEKGFLFTMLLGSEPAHVADGLAAGATSKLALPSHHQIHDNHATAGFYALVVAAVGTFTAYLFYGARQFKLNPSEVQSRFPWLYTFLAEKWRFDDLYDVMFVKPVHIVARWCAATDRLVFDGILHGACRIGIVVSHWDRLFDENIVDGLVNWVSNVTYGAGSSFRYLQTGRLRQYVMFIVVGVVLVGGFGLFWLMLRIRPS